MGYKKAVDICHFVYNVIRCVVMKDYLFRLDDILILNNKAKYKMKSRFISRTECYSS